MIEEKYQDLNFEQSSFLEKSLFAIDVKDIFHLLIIICLLYCLLNLN